MVDVAQLVEHQIVALVVMGSIPIIHPKKNLQINKKTYTLFLSLNYLKYSGCGAIGSALALGARGCQFESGHPDHFLKEMYDI